MIFLAAGTAILSPLRAQTDDCPEPLTALEYLALADEVFSGQVVAIESATLQRQVLGQDNPLRYERQHLTIAVYQIWKGDFSEQKEVYYTEEAYLDCFRSDRGIGYGWNPAEGTVGAFRIGGKYLFFTQGREEQANRPFPELTHETHEFTGTVRSENGLERLTAAGLSFADGVKTATLPTPGLGGDTLDAERVSSPVYGSYQMLAPNFALHNTLEMLYVGNLIDGEGWASSSAYGDVYLSKSLYPYAYSPRQGWIFLQPDKQLGNAWYYRVDTAEYVHVPDTVYNPSGSSYFRWWLGQSSQLPAPPVFVPPVPGG